MNDADRHLLTLFSAALERETAAERAAFLDEACADDPDLRGRVEALIQAHGRPGRFLGTAVTGATIAAGQVAPDDAEGRTAPHDARPEGPGTTIGPYRLLQVIGEGGMGTVYMAEQSEPVRRRVALKVVRAGMDSRQVLARFEAERQALAMMDHPNIARVLDAGTAPNGRSYFAMELVKGVPITKFCDERRLTPRERIELFVPVCQAVQHAHQKGIIHRDLKPSNVLVALYDDRPVPKVIDFGIAKATGPPLGEHAVFTEFGAIIGTLEYMSPEQAQLNQLDVDTRSDVYSLGVLLYELLTGTTPMDREALGQAALLDVLRLIREAETPRPSVRLSTGAGLPSIAADRGLEPKKLSGLVRGDLDWIVMKALEKDRSRRYETANALARDLRRHLDDEDVEACPPSAAYRFRKFARRHRTGLAVGAVVAAALLIATAVSTWQALRATRAERAAVESAEVERLTNTFFIDDLLGNSILATQVMGDIRPDPDIKVRTLVDRAAARIDGQFIGRPRLEAAVRRMIGRVYSELGLYEQARPYLERAEAIRREFLGEDDPGTLRTSQELGLLEGNLGLFGQAEARLRRTHEMAGRRLGAESGLAIVTLGNLARVLNAADRSDLAEEMSRRAVERAGRCPDLHPSQRIILQNNLALAVLNRGREAEAAAILEGSLREALAAVGEDHPMVPVIRINVALVQHQLGRQRESEQAARRALEGALRLYGDRHPHTLTAMLAVGRALRDQGRPVDAEEFLRHAYDLAREAFGAGSVRAIYGAIELGATLRRRGRLAEAEATLREALEPARRLNTTEEAEVEGNLGLVYEDMGRFPEAERLLRQAAARYAKNPSPRKRFLYGLKRSLAEVLSALGRHGEALDRFHEVLALSEAAFGPEDPLTHDILAGLATECRLVGRFEEAEALFPRVIAIGRKLKGPDDHDLLATRQNFAAFLHVRGRFEAAEVEYREALEGFRRTQGPDAAPSLTVLSNLGEMYRDWGRPDQAEPMLARALAGQERLRGPSHPKTLWTLWKLAELERDRGRPDQAEPMFRRCLEGYAKAQGEDGLELAMLRADLAMNDLKKREPDRAEPLLRQALATYERQAPDDWRRYEILGQLGAAIAARGRHAEAEPMVLGGYEGLMARRDRVTVDARPRLPEAGRRAVELYEAWGRPDKAATWREKTRAGDPSPMGGAGPPTEKRDVRLSCSATPWVISS